MEAIDQGLGGGGGGGSYVIYVGSRLGQLRSSAALPISC